MSHSKQKSDYEKKCLSILDSLDRVSNKENLGLNYDPRAILKNSNLNYEKNKYSEKETKSFDFSDKFFNFPKDLDNVNSEDELDMDEKAMKKYLETKHEKESNEQSKKESKNINNDEDFEKPIFNEKVKENIIRNSEKKLFKKGKIDYDQYHKVDYDFTNDNNGDFEMQTDKYDIFKKYKNQNLFFNELYSKDNIMDVCDMIGKEIEKGNDPNFNINENIKNKYDKNVNEYDIEETHIESNLSQNIDNQEDNRMQIDNTNSKFKKAPKRIQNKKYQY